MITTGVTRHITRCKLFHLMICVEHVMLYYSPSISPRSPSLTVKKSYKPSSDMLLPRGWALINHGLPNCVISQCEKTTLRNKKQAERQRANRVAAKKYRTENKEEKWQPNDGCCSTQRGIQSRPFPCFFPAHVVFHLRSVPCQPWTLP